MFMVVYLCLALTQVVLAADSDATFFIDFLFLTYSGFMLLTSTIAIPLLTMITSSIRLVALGEVSTEHVRWLELTKSLITLVPVLLIIQIVFSLKITPGLLMRTLISKTWMIIVSYLAIYVVSVFCFSFSSDRSLAETFVILLSMPGGDVDQFAGYQPIFGKIWYIFFRALGTASTLTILCTAIRFTVEYDEVSAKTEWKKRWKRTDVGLFIQLFPIPGVALLYAWGLIRQSYHRLYILLATTLYRSAPENVD